MLPALSGMADIEALISETIEIMTPLIAKPKMSDKYLRKPPFRYLHDIVVALVEAHQFPKRLTAPDLDHNNFTEKVSLFAVLICLTDMHSRMICLYSHMHVLPTSQDAKIDWLTRVIAETQELSGPLEVKPGKIVAGLEAEFTNKWLIAMAKCVRGDFTPAAAPAPAPAPAPKKKESSPKAPAPLKPASQQHQQLEEPAPRAAPPPHSNDDDGQENTSAAAAPPARAARLERPVTARRPPPAPRVGTSGADRPPPPPSAAAVVIIGDGSFFPPVMP